MKSIQWMGIVLAGITVSGIALATDDHTLPGTACKYYGPQAEDTFFDPAGEQANGLKNTSATSKPAVCPIQRDALTADNVEYASVTASDAGFNCDFYYRPSDGATGVGFNHTGTVSLAGGRVRYEFWSGSDDQDTSSSASYAIYCGVVPAGGVIYRISVAENT